MKKWIFVFSLAFALSLYVNGYSGKVSANTETTLELNQNVQMQAVDRYWKTLERPGIVQHLYYEESSGGYLYRGYLSFAGYGTRHYIYEGYLYREPLPYPIPLKLPIELE